MKKLQIIFLLLSIYSNYFSQAVSIGSGNLTTCNGVIHDTGGAGGGGYSNNEDFSIVICSDDPLKKIVLNLQNVILDPTVGAGGAAGVDYIQIFDGVDNTATLLHTVQGSSVSGYLISPTLANTSGCLTVVYHSNDVGTGNFTLAVSCEYSCLNPFAAATANPDTIARICKGESVTFDASSSFAQPGFNLDMYYWDYDEGADLDSISGVTTTHVFNNEGAYSVLLKVRDDNPDFRCFNTNAVEMVVLVAPDPIFNPLDVGSSVCLGESVVLTASPSQYSQSWTDLPSHDFGGAVYIPDQVGSCFNSTLDFASFGNGAQLTSINDLLSLNMNFEHSYMGDLSISIICPTGQSVLLHDQGGSGTLLGVPIDDETSGPGVGWDYSWSPTSTNGTWESNAASNTTLPAGTYQSENSLNALIGCDLNGTWQLQICDNLGSDDGYIFSWSMDFSPSLLPGVSSFTPHVGLQSDSSFWAVAPNSVMSADGNILTVTPTSSGSFNYSYTIIDNHGCTNDTTVSVTINPNPTTNAGLDATVCTNVPFQLGASVSPNPGAVVYSWSPATGLSDPNISNPTVTTANNVTYTVKAYKSGHPLCFTEDQIDVTVTLPPTAGTDNSIDLCQSDVPVDVTTLLDATATAGGVWEDGSGNSTTTLFNPALLPTDTLLYITGDASVSCTDTAKIAIQVALPFVLNQSNDTLICENGTAVLSVSPTGGFENTFTETWNQGLVGNGAHSVMPLVNTCYDVFVTDGNGCISQTETICVTLKDPLIISTSGDVTICEGLNTSLSVPLVSGGDGNYNFVWSDETGVISNVNQTSVSPTSLTQYCVAVSDHCETTPVSECLNVDLYNQPEAIFSADKVNGCFPIQVTFTNETDPTLVNTVEWDLGNASLSDELVSVTTVYGAPICYDVRLTITSPDGCIDDTLMQNYICPFDYPVANFEISPNPTTFFDTDIEMTNSSSADATVFDWDFGSSANPPVSSLENLRVRFPSEEIGEYPIQLIVTNADGCQDSITRNLIINSVFTLYVPSAFSPNNDGVNDEFYVKGESVSEEDFSLRIFDRNGTIVFETTKMNDYWTGVSKSGNKLPTGMYVWRVLAKDIYTNERKEFFGHVAIIK